MEDPVLHTMPQLVPTTIVSLNCP